MKLIPLSSVVVASNRQRREFDPEVLQELVTSISESAHGLLHPIVLREEQDKFVLVAGERRLRAISDIYDLGGTFKHDGEVVPPGQVPYTTLGELSVVDAMEAELEENVRRKDLTMMERAQATAALFDLRNAQAGAKGELPVTVAAIAQEVRGSSAGNSQERTRREIIIAKHAKDPEVAKATSIDEAFKIVKKKEEQKKNVEFAAVIGRSFKSTNHQLTNEDSLVWAEGCMPESFDIILTDPPYGMGADQFGDSGTGAAGAVAHFYDDSYATWQHIIRKFAEQAWRVAKPDAHLYAFCDLGNFAEFKGAAEVAGWKVFRTPLIWHNPNGFRAPWPAQGPQRKYECILFAVKGMKKVNAVVGDVLTYAKDAALGHPAQKPVPLLVDLLRRSAAPGDKVWDPFAGSGSTLEACNELKLTCVGQEIDPGSYGIAAKRLKAMSEFDEGLF
jgi:site-specific DNA-methyltransferase (adenine-specific)